MEKFIREAAKKSISRVLMPAVLLSILASGFAKDYSIKNFSKSDYMAEYQNWKVDMGPDNYIYVANNAGLLVYDGVNWEFYKTTEITNLRAVKVDKNKGRIYTSGYREMGYWEWDSLGSLNYTSLTPIASSRFSINEEFWNIVIQDDRVYFQSFHAIFIYQNNNFKVIKTSGFLNTITEIGENILIHIRDQGIYKISGDSFLPYLVDDFFLNKLVRFIVPWKEGELLIGTASNGLFKYDGHHYIQAFNETDNYFRTNTINRGTLLNKDTLIIGTLLDGLIAVSTNEDIVFRINEEAGLQNNTVLDILPVDKTIIASLDRGISIINLQPDKSYEIHTVTEIGASYSAAIYNGNLYLGTNQGLYLKPLDSNNEDFALVPGTQNQVWDCKVYDNQLFICHNSGTFIIKDGVLTQISDIEGGFNIIKNSFQTNTLFQSTYSDLLMYRKVDGNWKLSNRIKDFSDLIRYLELDHLNHLWAGHMRRSVYKLKLNDKQDSIIHITYYGLNSVFKKDYGINVFKVENRIVFTSGEKLYTYDDINDSIVPYSQYNQSLGIYAGAHRIVKSFDHHYWFITPESLGLFHFQLDGITLVKEYPSEIFDYHVIEGYENVIPIDKYKAIYCLENGYAMLNADPENQRKKQEQVNLNLRSISLINHEGNQSQLALYQEKYNIPYAKNSLVLQYAYPDYISEQIKCSYIVTGLQPQWSEPTHSGIFHLNRIPPGEYTIMVKAENEWHEESRIQQLKINVRLPWYRSVVSILIYMIILLGIIIYVRYTSVKKVKAREKKKRDAKEQELVKLRNQNLRIDLSFKSRELANSTMSIIKKNEFLLHLKDILKDHKYQLGSRYPDKFYISVIKKIDKNISSGDDWRIFETNVEKAHEFFLQKLISQFPELTHSDLRLCTYLRMNLSSKEIAPLMKISVRGVENHRYRLRKKLNIPSNVNLTDFILAFEV